MSYGHLKHFLAHRTSDPRLQRIIEQFLTAGVMEDGVISASDQGTPQGGMVAPLLANIWFCYTLDLWFEKRYAKSCRVGAYLARFADNFVACFQRKGPAGRLSILLKERVAAFDLKAEATKRGYCDLAIKR